MKFDIKRLAAEYRHIIAGFAVVAVAYMIDPFQRASPPIGSAWLELGLLVAVTLGAVAVSGGFRTLLEHKRLTGAALATATLIILVPTLFELGGVVYDHTIGVPDEIWTMDGTSYKTPLESLVDALVFGDGPIMLAIGVTTILVVAISRPTSREELSSLYWFILPPTVALIGARGVLRAAQQSIRRDRATVGDMIYHVAEPIESVLGLGLILWIMWGVGLVAYEVAARYGVEELSAPGEAA